MSEQIDNEDPLGGCKGILNGALIGFVLLIVIIAVLIAVARR